MGGRRNFCVLLHGSHFLLISDMISGLFDFEQDIIFFIDAVRNLIQKRVINLHQFTVHTVPGLSILYKPRLTTTGVYPFFGRNNLRALFSRNLTNCSSIKKIVDSPRTYGLSVVRSTAFPAPATSAVNSTIAF